MTFILKIIAILVGAFILTVFGGVMITSTKDKKEESSGIGILIIFLISAASLSWAVFWL
ncbi:hypothetical protein [Virgibacillus proomii]|uniref:hypothetical protein n=1 Tax=Virgibacillus proomii TaxID=84407 RepID=UPI0015C39A8C|nr:hypothetical protein [Virgibacillus proomii]